MIYKPEMLILDEPTSGVDPVARDEFWQILIDLSRRDNVTIFISTHFMNEAERCDRISLMHAGRVLVSDTPAALIAKRGAKTLEDAFIGYLEDAVAEGEPEGRGGEVGSSGAKCGGRAPRPHRGRRSTRQFFDLRRMFSYAQREALELMRDPIRITLAALGSVILMFIVGYGISMDVEDLSFAVLDRDQTTTSRDYTLNLAGSRYFIEQAADRRLCRSRPAHAHGRAELGHRDPAGLRARPGARPTGSDRRLDRRCHAAAGRDRARLCAGNARALADAEGVACAQRRFRGRSLHH